MRFSRLASGHAGTLGPEAVVGADLALRPAKSGELGLVDLPAVAGCHPHRLRIPFEQREWCACATPSAPATPPRGGCGLPAVADA